MAYQICVFAENKPGRLERVTRILAEVGVNIRAITISSSNGFGVIKLLVDQPDKAYNSLISNNLPVSKKEVIAILMEDRPGGLHRILKVLGEKNINIEDAYGFVIKNQKRAVLVVEVDKIPEVMKVLKEKGLQTLSEDELYGI